MRTPPEPVAVEEHAVEVDEAQQIEPILDRRCAVCHSCYDSPCQLKLTSYEGVDRGGTKVPVYDGARIHAEEPTRLFVDADSTAHWRRKGFHSVTASDAPDGKNNALMLHLLDAKRSHPTPHGGYCARVRSRST